MQTRQHIMPGIYRFTLFCARLSCNLRRAKMAMSTCDVHLSENCLFDPTILQRLKQQIFGFDVIAFPDRRVRLWRRSMNGCGIFVHSDPSSTWILLRMVSLPNYRQVPLAINLPRSICLDLSTSCVVLSMGYAMPWRVKSFITKPSDLVSVA